LREKKGLRRGNEEELGREEIRRAIRRLKNDKAMEMDGLPNKIWKYEGEEMKG